jgi:hypothetical protein
LNRIDPLGLLDIHIWNYQGSNEAWGHASMTLDDGTHISWWPDNPVPPEFPLYSAPAFPNQSYADDVAFEGRGPDHVIPISGLDEAAIKAWWGDFKSKNKWSTLSQNCSTTVADALDAGGGGDGVYLADWNSFWTPADVRGYADAIKDARPSPEGGW